MPTNPLVVWLGFSILIYIFFAVIKGPGFNAVSVLQILAGLSALSAVVVMIYRRVKRRT